MPKPPIDHEKLKTIVLSRGAHDSPSAGLCLMEAVAYVCGGPHTARPKCVSPTLADFGQYLNDVLPDDLRQQLVSVIPALPGTAGDGLDSQRKYLLLDWLVRTYLPTWLDLFPHCCKNAADLRSLSAITDRASAQNVGAVVRLAHDQAWQPRNADAALVTRRIIWAVTAIIVGTADDATRLSVWEYVGGMRQTVNGTYASTATQLQHSAIDLFTRMAQMEDESRPTPQKG